MSDYKKGHFLALPYHSRTNIAANTTINIGVQQGTALQTNRPCPVDGLVTGFFCNASAAPGAGETFDYTITLNGVPTAMAVQIAGAVQVSGQDEVNGFAVQEGDLLSVEVVTSLNSSVVMHSAVIRLKC